MANKKIIVEMSPESIKRAVRLLDVYKKRQKDKMHELDVRLAAIGLQAARIRFEQGAVEGNAAPEVRVEPIENGFKIIAEGGDLYIIEFGAGDAAGNHPDAATAPVDTSPGSLSRKNTGEYAKYGSWHHKINGEKRKYTELQAHMPMYYAAREMERNIEKIAKEVFGT